MTGWQDGPVGIVGLGLIGGSLARALKAAGATIFAADPDPEALRAAVAEGVADATGPVGEWAAEVRLCLLAVPLGATAATVAAVAPLLAPGTVLAETASLKGPVLAALAAVPDDIRPLALHPMAGREQRGWEASQATLFRGLPLLAVPVPGRPLPRSLLERLAAALGARPAVVAAADHDRIMARVSHLPYLLAAALLLEAEAGPGGEAWMAAAGSGFRDTSRVGASPPDMWQELLAANRGPTAEALKAAARRLQGWARDLAAGRPLADLEAAPAVRRRWEESGR